VRHKDCRSSRRLDSKNLSIAARRVGPDVGIIRGMEWLNYHHLLYFWMVAKEGGITKASAQLRLAHPTISGQLRQLEEALGEDLFNRVGRRLELTEMGRMVFEYADEIFTLGRELMDTVKGRPTGRPVRLTVGVVDALPKLAVRRMLEPAMRGPDPVRLVVREDSPERLLAELAMHQLDVVLADTPIGPGSSVRAFNHELGSCGTLFFAAPSLRARLEGEFPKCLDGAPFLMPYRQSAMRRQLEQFFEEHEISPLVVGEFQDSALLKTFGADGVGVFAGPAILEPSVRRMYEVEVIGRSDAVREHFYAWSVERKLKHPAVLALSAAARTELFPPQAPTELHA
jgi:LysR family transcriptional activator of nhaA